MVDSGKHLARRRRRRQRIVAAALGLCAALLALLLLAGRGDLNGPYEPLLAALESLFHGPQAGSTDGYGELADGPCDTGHAGALAAEDLPFAGQLADGPCDLGHPHAIAAADLPGTTEPPIDLASLPFFQPGTTTADEPSSGPLPPSLDLADLVPGKPLDGPPPPDGIGDIAPTFGSMPPAGGPSGLKPFLGPKPPGGEPGDNPLGPFGQDQPGHHDPGPPPPESWPPTLVGGSDGGGSGGGGSGGGPGGGHDPESPPPSRSAAATPIAEPASALLVASTFALALLGWRRARKN